MKTRTYQLFALLFLCNISFIRNLAYIPSIPSHQFKARRSCTQVLDCNLSSDSVAILQRQNLVKDIPINKVVAEPFSSARILFPNHTVAYPPQATQSFAPSDLRVPSWPLHTGLSLAWYPNYVYRVPSRPSYIYHVETGIDDNLQDTRRPRRQIEWLVTPYALIRGPTSKERLPEIGATVPVQPRKQLATSLASLQSQGLKIWRRQTRPELPSTSHDSKGARCRKEGGRVRKTDATIEKPARLVARRGME